MASSVDPGSGSPYWAVGYAPSIPYVGVLVQVIVPIVLFKRTRQHPSLLVRENARWAANWNLTVVATSALLLLLVLGAAIAEFVFLLEGLFSVSIGSMIAAMLVTVVHLVVTTVAVFRADSRVFRPCLAIPFFQ